MVMLRGVTFVFHVQTLGLLGMMIGNFIIVISRGCSFINNVHMEWKTYIQNVPLWLEC